MSTKHDPIRYGKVRFTSRYNGSTASLILTDVQQSGLTMTDISRLFPMSEALKMDRLQRSAYFNTFEEAFNFDMDQL